MLRYTRRWFHFEVKRQQVLLGIIQQDLAPRCAARSLTARASTTPASSQRVSYRFPVVSVTSHHRLRPRNLLSLHPPQALPAQYK